MNQIYQWNLTFVTLPVAPHNKDRVFCQPYVYGRLINQTIDDSRYACNGISGKSIPAIQGVSFCMGTTKMVHNPPYTWCFADGSSQYCKGSKGRARITMILATFSIC